MKIAIMFERLGPYHVARARATMEHAEVLVVESAPFSTTYKWARPNVPRDMHLASLTYKTEPEINPDSISHRVNDILAEFKPDVVALSGWGFLADLIALRWCVKNNIPAICMSESNHWDFKRFFFVEKIKMGIVANYSAGLSTSKSQLDYLVRLGLPRERVFSGYNVVDNEFFRNSAQEWRQKRELPEEISAFLPQDAKGRYFLASSRFVRKKNLIRLIEAYAGFRKNRSDDPADWPLVIIGDGEMSADILTKIMELRMVSHVHLPGFLQIDSLPRYYGTAGAFVHPSTTEQWGLVINEAMAAGLPVAASVRCGATEYLIENEVSGYVFDPYSTREIMQALQKLSLLTPNSSLADAGRASVDRLVPAKFGGALFAASCAAIKEPAKPSKLSSVILGLVIAVAARAKYWHRFDRCTNRLF